MGTSGTVNEVPTSPPAWIKLPEDLTANILRRLGTEEILENAQKVCTTWWKVCKDPAMWRVVDLNNPYVDGRGFDLMCRCAVDRSKGQLTALRISRFGDDGLLNYVAHRDYCPIIQDDCNGIALAIAKVMPNLYHLRLAGDAMKNEGLQAILDGCPRLELLDLVNCNGVDLRGALGERCSKQIKFMTSRSLIPSYDEMMDNNYDSLDDSDLDDLRAIFDGSDIDDKLMFPDFLRALLADLPLDMTSSII